MGGSYLENLRCKEALRLPELQSSPQYLRLTLERYGKILFSVFQEIFASIDKLFVLAERLDTRLSL